MAPIEGGSRASQPREPPPTGRRSSLRRSRGGADRAASEAVLHAATVDGLALALAHVLGAEHRWAVVRLLTEPGSRDAVLLDLAGLPAAP